MRLMSKKLRGVLKNASFWLFEFGQRFNLFIIPIHYYVPLSSTRQLRKTRDRWNRPVDLAPLPLSIDDQRRILTEWITPYEPEYRGNRTYLDGVNTRAGPGFGYIEAQALHGFIRKTRPRRIIEVGSGVSTWCILGALKLNQGESGQASQVTCIDPYPSEFLKSVPVNLKTSIVEELDVSFFDQLDAGDLLSIDSSHAVRCCGDVARMYLEVLPRLKPGVFIHIHDVMFPYMFPRDVEQVYMQSMETALLFALLAHSTHFEVLICLSLLHYSDQALLKRVFPEYVAQPNIGGLPGGDVKPFGDPRHFPSSTYLVTK
jgi:hypothetical protein